MAGLVETTMICSIMAAPRALSPAGDTGDIEGVRDIEDVGDINVTKTPPEFGPIRGVGGGWGLEEHWGHGATSSCPTTVPRSLGDTGDVIWVCHEHCSGFW